MGSNNHSEMRTPLILTALGAVLVFILASKIEFFEYLYKLTRAHNDYEVDELVAVIIYLWFVFACSVTGGPNAFPGPKRKWPGQTSS